MSNSEARKRQLAAQAAREQHAADLAAADSSSPLSLYAQWERAGQALRRAGASRSQVLSAIRVLRGRRRR